MSANICRWHKTGYPEILQRPRDRACRLRAGDQHRSSAIESAQLPAASLAEMARPVYRPRPVESDCCAKDLHGLDILSHRVLGEPRSVLGPDAVEIGMSFGLDPIIVSSCHAWFGADQRDIARAITHRNLQNNTGHVPTQHSVRISPPPSCRKLPYQHEYPLRQCVESIGQQRLCARVIQDHVGEVEPDLIDRPRPAIEEPVEEAIASVRLRSKSVVSAGVVGRDRSLASQLAARIRGDHRWSTSNRTPRRPRTDV